MKTKQLLFRIPTPIAITLLAILILTFILYYTGIFPVQASQLATATPDSTILEVTPIPIADVGDTTGIVVWGTVIVTVILAGLFWPRRQRTKKSS